MFQFEPQLYFSGDEKQLLLKLTGEGSGIVIDHTMPPELRAEAFDKDTFDYFWGMTFPLWLVDYKFSARAHEGTKNAPMNVLWEDHIDLEHLGLVKDHEVDCQRVWALLSIIGKYWRYKPVPGLLYQLCDKGATIDAMKDMLAKLADPSELKFDLKRLPELTELARTEFVSATNKFRRNQKLKKKKRKK